MKAAGNQRNGAIMSAEIFERATEAVVTGNATGAVEVAKEGLAEGVDPLHLMDKGFIPGINKVGDLFGSGRLFLPELVMSANAMERATELINEAIPSEQEQTRGRVVIATVEGDVHDIGKTIVVSLLKANSFDVLDLGRDVAVATLIEEAGLKDRFKTMVGGAPVTHRWAKRIGADGFAEDAGEAVKKAKALLDLG
jgi:trimethylamine corrinoid protein